MQPTERLYYDDSYLWEFDATVVAREDRGGRPAVALDRSAFYPEGGGQPADRGELGGAAVLDVQSDEGGVVWHTIDGELDGGAVRGLVDSRRRLDHMQQHHGQHLLSAAFERLGGPRTVAFHLGAEAVTIDLDTPALAAEVALAAEELANQVIWEDRPVLARFVTPGELAAIQLRRPPTVSGPVRVVSVPGFDNSACGGTHPRATGGVGLLHVRRWERRGETTRLEFVCGGRALRDLRWKHAALGRIAGGMSVGLEEAEAAVGRLREAEGSARRGLEEARGRLLTYEAAEIAARARAVGGVRAACELVAERPQDELRALARLVADAGCVAVLGMAGEKGHLIVARGAGLPADAGAILRAGLAAVGGRGGGRPELAQGGVADPALLPAALDAALAALGG